MTEYLLTFSGLFPYIHTHGMTASYRLAKEPLKKIRDECAVLSHFLQSSNKYRYICHNFGNGIPDAWLWTENACIDVEITVALAKMRLAVVERLNKFGGGSGFLPLADGHDLESFRDAANADAQSYSPAKWVDVLYSGVMTRVRKKAISDRQGILLIECPIGEKYASAGMVEQLVQRIVPDLPPNGFEQIFILDADRVTPLK